MLNELRIENFAIIQHLELDFKGGLTVFTGETGAGKSIILDAIEALVGGRAEAGQVRSGAERAAVEATFSFPRANQQAISELLRREELLEDENEVSLCREMRREGRSVARVNGRVVNSTLLRELGSYLVDIHGQSEHLSLLNVHQHLGLLDRYANSGSVLENYRGIYRNLSTLRRELQEVRQSEQEAQQRIDLLTFQAQEIEAARLQAGEEEPLKLERDRLANAENLAALVQESLALLEEGNSDGMAISDLLGQVVEKLAALSRIDTGQTRLAEQVSSGADLLADLTRDLRNYQEGIEFNPRRLEQVEERLNLINVLKRKYGSNLDDVLAYGRDARQKLETIAHAGERIAELVEEEKSLLTSLGRLGQMLTGIRHEATRTLEQAVENELDELNMSGARFKVDLFQETDEQGVPLDDGRLVAFNENGVDRVQFLIAPNPGEGFKPLVKIASGGETSRLMLALKDVLARADDIPTLIFDEIDQGIGGRVGMVVGEKLWKLARQHQVMCVTHLPQLAAFGEQHYRVRKEVLEGRTLTLVDNLTGADRLDELAQMLGNLSDANRGAAQETLELAQARAAELSKDRKD